MKKAIILGGLVLVLVILVFFMFDSSVSVSDNRDEAQTDKKIVLTTFTVLQDIAQNVGGDVIDVRSITSPGEDIHSYEPTPDDLVRAQDADLILDNGLNLELWAENLYESVPDVPHIRVTEGIEPLPISEGSYEGKANPHAWMSPNVALTYVENIRKAFVELAPEHTEQINQNAAEYSAQLQELDNMLREKLGVLPENKRFLVTCEGAFSYLTNDYDLGEIYMWPINSDANGTPRQIANVVDAVRENNIPTVYCESTVNTDAMEQVAKETGARFGGVFYVDALSPVDGPAPTYLQMMQYNIDTLISGWE